MTAATMLRRPLLRVVHSAPLMLAFSSFARAGSYLLPVPVLHWIGGPAAATFWLLAVTLIGMQNLLFLGSPQIFVRMLAVARADGRQSETSSVVLSEAAICRLMVLVFRSASAVITLLTATIGSWAMASSVAKSDNSSDLWAAWAIVVLSSPLRVLLLSRLTFLNGRGDIALPRFYDGLAWSLGGLLAAVTLWLSGSLLAMTLAAQAPVLALGVCLTLRARAAQWDVLRRKGEPGAAAMALIEVWPPIWRAGLGILFSLGPRQGAGVLLAQYAPAEETGAYLLALNIMTVLMTLTAAPMQSVLHRISELYGRSETSTHAEIAANARAQSLWIVALFSGVMALLIPVFALLPFHHAFVSLRIWGELALGSFVQRYSAAHLQHYTITNRVVWHWLDGVTGIINIILCLLLIPVLHGEGAALASLISMLPVYAWVPTFLAVRHFGLAWPQIDRSVVAPAITMAFLFASAAALGSAI